MPLDRIRIANYRSLRELTLPLHPRATVLVGANGCGKSNLYRALRLLEAAATGRLAETLVAEGGMPSVLWAGEGRRKDEIREVRLSVEVSIDRFSYRLACGLPLPGAVFKLDPEVKEEDLGVRLDGRKTPAPLCERRSRVVSLRGDDGSRQTLTDPLDPSESVLTQIADPRRYPELALLRETLLAWRFYHQFRTDADSPLRQPRLGVRSPVLAHDGANLASALLTIQHIRADDRLQEAVDAAFPGCVLGFDKDDDRQLLGLAWHQPGMRRPLSGGELSDGTLRFLCLAAALLTPRPPLLLVLNEPETSLHHALLDPLADLIAEAATRAQVVVTTHARDFADRIAAATGGTIIPLRLRGGQTVAGYAGEGPEPLER